MTEITFKWGDAEHVLSAESPNVAVLVQRTINHIYGNEAAAVEKRLRDAKNEDGSAKHTEADIESAVADWRAEKLDLLLNGVLGTRAAGQPRQTSFEALMSRIATERMTAKLAKAKLKLPRAAGKNKDGSDRPAESITLNTKDGPKPFTRDELIANELAKYGDEIRAEATRRQEEAAAAADGVDVDDII